MSLHGVSRGSAVWMLAVLLVLAGGGWDICSAAKKKKTGADSLQVERTAADSARVLADRAREAAASASVENLPEAAGGETDTLGGAARGTAIEAYSSGVAAGEVGASGIAVPGTAILQIPVSARDFLKMGGAGADTLKISAVLLLVGGDWDVAAAAKDRRVALEQAAADSLKAALEQAAVDSVAAVEKAVADSLKAVLEQAAADSVAATEKAAADSAAALIPETGPFKTVWAFLDDLFDLSSKNVSKKAISIAVVALIAVIARFFMAVIQTISRFLVYSRWGPLKYIFRNNQRSITIHALLISLVKYVIYFTALGYILGQLGINYTTYLASLSLIGIAIGFGSQGLVQDIVTGFFILFENQFSVGEMVEISGQVGFVEMIGLRTTRIRNYFGADIILQNRNIPMAIRYPKGYWEAGVDVAVASEEAGERAAELLQRIGAELAKQFQEVIMKTPEVTGLLKLETGELFVRLQAAIWPVQQWVIDLQMVPRIREIFKREGIEIPGDRVVSFYHFPERKQVSVGLIQRIRNVGQQVRDNRGLYPERD